MSAHGLIVLIDGEVNLTLAWSPNESMILGALTAVAVNNVAILITAAGLYMCLRETRVGDDWLYVGCIAIALLADSVARCAMRAEELSVARDWIVVISQAESGSTLASELSNGSCLTTITNKDAMPSFPSSSTPRQSSRQSLAVLRSQLCPTIKAVLQWQLSTACSGLSNTHCYRESTHQSALYTHAAALLNVAAARRLAPLRPQ